MDHGSSVVSIAGAALIMQSSLLAILAIGAAIRTLLSDFRMRGLAPLILFVALLSFAVLLFSDALSPIWSPMFSAETALVGLKWSTALLIVFIIDIFAIAIVVAATGGSMASPFTPLYFIVPPLALFLRDSGRNLVIYLILVVILFSLNCLYAQASLPDRYSQTEIRVPYWVVSLLCVGLATVIGWVTRPL